MKKIILFIATLIAFIMFNGCAGAMHTMIKKRNLDVQTKMSATVFLEPVVSKEKTVYLNLRNTTDKNISTNIQANIEKAFTSKGYSLTDNPNDATFIIQINLLQIGKSDLRSAQYALQSGFGGAIVGAGLAASTHSNEVSGGIIGGFLGVIGDALVDDTYITMITDIQIRQKPIVGDTHISYVKWQKHQTRVVSVANQVNLEFKEAKPKLIQGLIRVLSGLL